MSIVRFEKRAETYGVTFSYDPEIVELLKLSVPAHARSWSRPRREWLVDAIYARELADTLRGLGHTIIGVETSRDGCQGWAQQLFRAVGSRRAPAVHRALSRVLHPDNRDTGCPTLQRELNAARTELEGLTR